MNEAKQLAKELVWMTDESKKERLNEFEREEVNDELNRINKKISQKGYSADLILRYMNEYRNLLLGEHQAWINDEI